MFLFQIVYLQGGVQTNVVPEELTAVFDVRIPPNVDHEAFEQTILGWCREAGDNITIDYEQKNTKIASTKLDDTNAYWIAFKAACDKLKINLQVGIRPGVSDSRFIRGVFVCFLF